MFKKIYFLFFIFLLFIISCNYNKEEKNNEIVNNNKNGGTLYYGSIADASVLNPILSSDNSSSFINKLVFASLVKYDKDFNIVPYIAEKFVISDDGKVIEFFLRKNILWHDNKVLTAFDVEFTYKSIIEEKNKSHLRSDFLNIEKFEIINEYNFKVIYKKPFASALESWEIGILPKHLLEDEDISNTRFNREPIGVGPYKFVEWIANDKIILQRNSNYFLSKGNDEEGYTPYIENIIFKVIPDQSVMFLELQNNKIDIMDLKPDQYLKHKDQPWFTEHFKIYKYPESSYTYLGYNLENSFFKEKDIRIALSMSIDVDEIINVGLKGLAKRSLGIYNSIDWAFNDKIEPIEYNIEKAKAIFEKYGYKDTNNDGYIDKNGKNFEFSIYTNNGNKNRELAVKLIQNQLKKVGVKVNIELYEWSKFITLIDEKKFDSVLLAWTLSPEPDVFSIWHSSQIPDLENNKHGLNAISYKNDKIDKLIEEGRITIDKKKRIKIYNEIQKIIYDDQPYSFLYINETLTVANKKIKNLKIEKKGLEYNIEEWYIEK